MLKALFVTSCLLAVLYVGLGVFSANQVLILQLRDEVSSWRCWIPQTTQRQVQLIITFLSFTRAAFFLVAIFAWDSSMGSVERFRSAFYSLDELATVAFFTLTCALALFWAEIYYTAIDNILEFKELVRPIVQIVNVVAYAGVVVCAYFAIHASESSSDYIYWNFSVLVAILFFIAALIFTFYAQRAASELIIVPLQLAMRRERTDELYKIFAVFMFALIVRAACLLAMSEDNLDTDSTGAIILLALYFLALEWLPMIFATIFYRVQQDDILAKGRGRRGMSLEADGGSANAEERQPLQGCSMEEVAVYVHNPNQQRLVASLVDKLHVGVSHAPSTPSSAGAASAPSAENDDFRSYQHDSIPRSR